MLELLSHTAGLEASATGRPTPPGVALAKPALALCLVVYDLVHRGIFAGTLRDGPRLLPGIASTPPPPRQDLRRLREGAGGLARARLACRGPGRACPPDAGLRSVFHGGRVYSPGL